MRGNDKTIYVKKLISSLACLLMVLTPQYSFAIDTSPPPPVSEAPQPGAPAPQAQKFTETELEKLLAPIALYPDALLAQLLPASAYPLEIVQAQRWLDKKEAAVAKQDFTGGDARDWDPSVKALLRFPDVVRKLSDDLDWTTNLGDAIVNQPQDVANVIQLLRAKAQNAGTLKTTKEQVVTTQKRDGRDVVTIESADPSVIYVPSYDPVAVYNPLPALWHCRGASYLWRGCRHRISMARQLLELGQWSVVPTHLARLSSMETALCGLASWHANRRRWQYQHRQPAVAP